MVAYYSLPFFLLLLLNVVSGDADIMHGYYYSPAPIGVNGGGSLHTSIYGPYFSQIHERDMKVLQTTADTIRISSLGTSSDTLSFLDTAYKYNISVLAGFGLSKYVFDRPDEMQNELLQLRNDFTKFIVNHQHPAIKLWCLGDVGDNLFTVDTSLAQYPVKKIYYLKNNFLEEKISFISYDFDSNEI